MGAVKMFNRNKKNSEIAWWCNDAWKDPENVGFAMKTIEDIARNDPEEFSCLIGIFNEETDINKKIILSYILVNFKHQPVKDFFITLIQKQNELGFHQEESSPFESTPMDDAMSAAINLIHMSDRRGIEFIKKALPVAPSVWPDWIISDLSGSIPGNIPVTSFGLRALLELADSYEELNKKVDREKIAQKLEEL